METRVNTLQKQMDDDMVAQLKYIASKKQNGNATGPPAKRQRGGDGHHSKRQGQGPPPSDLGDPELSRRIQQNMNEIITISEEKMKRAQQIYDLVDQHVRKLDKDLQSFGAEVSKERERLGLLPQTAQQGGTASEKSKKVVAATAAVPEEAKSPDVLYKEALAVADADEPKYCYCNRISFGEMIACDNDDCPIEWFHFSCVGLTPENRPKGQWFCPDCKP